ncbi:hypothetical protein O7A70_11890 [Mesorhizobium sp. Cs1299R1N1]|uniref:hypothetical protein n=1 Tax=Mesorhizobium sp. Cs1299R1N1 TaxID=3015172 RepID=UPI00301D3415
MARRPTKKTAKKMSAGPHSLALRLDVMGVTAYMTKAAIEELIKELVRISASDPEELHDVHVAMHFGGWTPSGEYIAPSFGHHHGLGTILTKLRNEQLKDGMTKAEIDRDITPDEAYRAFDITIMHVSPEVVQRVTIENEAAESSSTD